MASLLARAMDAPDERREFSNGRLDVVALDGHQVGLFSLEPGWRWSRSVAPLAGTATCQVPHLGYVVSGRLHVLMDDGSEGEAGSGDAFWIAPGHDAWVVGDQTAVLVDVRGAGDYAKAH